MRGAKEQRATAVEVWAAGAAGAVWAASWVAGRAARAAEVWTAVAVGAVRGAAWAASWAAQRAAAGEVRQVGSSVALRGGATEMRSLEPQPLVETGAAVCPRESFSGPPRPHP